MFLEEAIFLHSPVFPPVLWLPGASVGTPAGVNLGGRHEKKSMIMAELNICSPELEFSRSLEIPAETEVTPKQQDG